MLIDKYSAPSHLNEQADVLRYLIGLNSWANQNEKINNQFDSKMEQINKTHNRRLAVEESSKLFRWLGAQIIQCQQSFNLIIPPSQLQNSHATLRQIEGNTAKLADISIQLSRVLSASRSANLKQMKIIKSRFNTLLDQFTYLKAQLSAETASYVQVLKEDLAKESAV